MKFPMVSSIALVALICVLMFSVASPASPTPGGSQPAAAAAPAAENHPQIHDALAALRNARAHLEHAAHDFGGHRVDAIKATDAAIQQLEVCLKYDK